MCGIFGYVGSQNNVADMVLEGLKTLEYRGYDSWGVAVKKNEAIVFEKHVGKIGDATVSLPASSIGIGHTRWATHGGVTIKNAHPHVSCDKVLAIVHNGIVENFQALKDDLTKKGHTFVSETDSEVIVHLIEEHLKSEDFEVAVKAAFLKLHGLNAIVVMSSQSNEIICVKNGSPLVVGVSDSGYFLASDITGIIKHTNQILFIEDNQMVVMGQDLKLLQLPEGRELKAAFSRIDWTFEAANKGQFPHFLIKEIHDQPMVIRNIAMTYKDQIEQLANRIKNAYGTFMLGCGTASYAALAGTYLFSRIAKRHVNFTIGSEFSYLEDYVTDRTLIIPISQSGETIDVVEPVGVAKKRGAQVAAITNVLGSTIYRQSDFQLLLGAGPEKAVISTKAYTAMISVLLYTAYSLVGETEKGREILLKVVDGITRILMEDYIESVKALAQKLVLHKHMYILGRGPSYPAALEFALKMKETTYIHAEGFAGGELKHGVIALIEEGTPVVALAPDDETYDSIISNAQEVKARGAMVIGVSPKPNKVFDIHMNVDDAGDGTLILSTVVAQLLAYYLAIAKGFKDPDKPRNLAKSVTVK